MTRRLPILPTLLVAIAVAAMVGLGFWQLDRRTEKLALLRELAANPSRPPVAFPNPPVGGKLLFRRSSAMCLKPVSFTLEGAGREGFRVIAQCSTGAEGPGFAAQIGTTRDPRFKPQWRGGLVRGLINQAPNHSPLIASMFGQGQPKTLMIVADTPAPGLGPSHSATIESIPNNHLAYAVQWFLFAAVGLTIYVLALRKRAKGIPRP